MILIREMRTKKGITQEEMAVEFNIDRSTIAKWENGSSFPSFRQLLKLKKFFGCTLDELLREDGETNVECK